MQLIHEHEETGAGNLRRDHDNRHDHGVQDLVELEPVNLEAVSGHRGEIHAQDRGTEGDDRTVHEADRYVKVLG